MTTLPQKLTRVLLAAVLALVIAQPSISQNHPATEQAMRAIRPEAIRAHMSFLSDSLLEGRDPGTRGFDIAARYVASQMESMGVRPAGVAGTWYQPVPLRKIVLDAPQSSVVFVQNGKEQKLKDAVDYVLSGDALRPDSSVEADVVFAGFGVTAPEMNYDDYAGIDARGKIVAFLDNAPARFPSNERAYYSEITNKERNAVAHGAVGLIAMDTPEDQKREPWEWLVPQIQAGSMYWLDEKGLPHNSFPQLRGGAFLSQSGAELLFAGATRTLEQVFAAAKASQPQAFALPVRVRIHEVSRHTAIRSPNIVGVLPGSDPKLRDQYVVYSAHVDHLGLCPPVDGDNVCHGAWDNASGTAFLLEVARAFASLPRAPRRSVLFLGVTGEEMGLIGSDYFAYFPTVPRKAIVANVNIDSAPGLLFPMKDIVPMGIEHSSLDKYVKEAARLVGYDVSPDPMPEENIFTRSDQYSFVLQGIPSVFIVDGVRSVDPKINGLEVSKKWLVTLYHTPRDNMKQAFDFQSGAKAARLNFLVGYLIAQDEAVPVWHAHDFFGTKFGPRHSAATASGN